jgi:lipid A ethanolaminephosphotransferase
MGLKLFRTTGYSTLLDTQTAAAWKSSGSIALGRNPLGLLSIVSAWIATVGNLALWRELGRLGKLHSAGDYAFAAAMAVIIFGALGLIFSLLAWRHTIKPLLALLLIATALGMHFMLSYGIVIDTPMITNVLQTDPRETRDLLNWKLFFTLLIVAGLPIAWMWRQQVQRLRWSAQLLRNVGYVLAAGLCLVIALGLSFKNFAPTMRNHTQLRYLINPLNSLYALVDLATSSSGQALPFASLGEDAQLLAPASAKPPLLVLVLGETGRVGNFSINGYARATTPELAQLMRSERISSLRNVTSCGTSTAASVPCMFSHLGRAAYDSRTSNYENLLDVLQRAGLAVLWLDNQAGCKGVCDRVASASTSALTHPTLCNSGECFDGIMLEGLSERIAALPADKRAKGVVVVMHQMGSHGPAYYKRAPPEFKKFQPECTSNALSDCSREQVVNSYDNTIAYTDHFLASVIKWLKAHESTAQAAILYIADHGESLGENNIYLHGLPYAIAPDVQKRVPWITWLSTSFAARSRIDHTCLQNNADQALSHDNLFHSVLGLVGVQTAMYQRSLDVYAACVK